ncbi:MAG: LSU ribosomal protein L30P [Candidatus Nitrotoga sp. MKT]|nr:MAG: LSU ribosomal protein L30P [Candidatus Nitrotoga sp. MKT]
MVRSQQKAKITVGMFHVTLIKSVIGTKESHRACVRGLGLRRLNHTVMVEDTPAVRGMINKVYYLVKCEV